MLFTFQKNRVPITDLDREAGVTFCQCYNTTCFSPEMNEDGTEMTKINFLYNPL